MTAPALTCISADSERSQHVCLFPSAPNSPLTPFKKLICLGHLSKPPQTFGEDFRRSRLFLSLIIFTSFHTSMRWAPMKGLNSWSTGQRFLKKNALIEALRGVPSRWVRSQSSRPCAGQSVRERTISFKQTYIFIHGECLFWSGVPLSHMQIQSFDSHMVWRCGSSLSAWKVGGKEAFSWSESPVNRALHPALLFCKWIRSSGIMLWTPRGSNRHA